MLENDDWLSPICANCGCRLGTHLAGSHKHKNNLCPPNENSKEWDKSPGTVFQYKKEYES